LRRIISACREILSLAATSSAKENNMANLTSKELTALDEQIGSEENLVKKYSAMASLCQDTKIQQDLETCAAKHREHYNTLVSFLQ
jgi:hypothetical protein